MILPRSNIDRHILQHLFKACILLAVMNMSCSRSNQVTGVEIYCESFSAHTPVRVLPELLVENYSSRCRVKVSDTKSLNEFAQILRDIDTTGSVVEDGGFDTRVLGVFHFGDGRTDTAGFGKWNMYYDGRTYDKVDSTLFFKLLEYTDESQTHIAWWRRQIERLDKQSGTMNDRK